MSTVLICVIALAIFQMLTIKVLTDRISILTAKLTLMEIDIRCLQSVVNEVVAVVESKQD